MAQGHIGLYEELALKNLEFDWSSSRTSSPARYGSDSQSPAAKRGVTPKEAQNERRNLKQKSFLSDSKSTTSRVKPWVRSHAFKMLHSLHGG